MSMPTRTCGACSLCCKVMGIDTLEKPAGTRRPRFNEGAGCAVHGSHPEPSRDFHCLWLISPAMPDQVRPDRCKVVITIEEGGAHLVARADPDVPEAWRREPIYGQLKRWAADSWLQGRTIWAMVGRRTWLIAPDRDIDLGEIDEGALTTFRQAPDGTISVIVFPPNPAGGAYDPGALQAAIDAGQGRRIVSRPPQPEIACARRLAHGPAAMRPSEKRK